MSSVQGTGPQRGPSVYPHQPTHGAAVLNMPNGTVVDESNTDGHKQYAVFSNDGMNSYQMPQTGYAPQYGYAYGYPGYQPVYNPAAVQYQAQMITQQPIQTIQQRPQQIPVRTQPPPQKRERKILQFVDPTTNENIDIGNPDKTTTAPQSVPPPPPSKSPVSVKETASSTPSVVESVRNSTDEARSAFQQMVT
uniref:Uncharacterized protein n=1 Tax=Panagrolaimus sp. JU765 TaxID=591449 RepID=A0AC34PZ48_9BILA